MSEEQIEDELDAIIRLFCCLHNRDTFVWAYSKYQAQRLLEKTSLNTEKEQSMISKLKIECGFNTVSKLTRMFTDMELSKDVMKEFKDFKRGGMSNSGIAIHADILTSGIWPEQTHFPVKLPPNLKECATTFEQFYKHKHSGRHLQWLHRQGTT